VINYLERESEGYRRGSAEVSTGPFVSYPSGARSSSLARSLPTLIGADVSSQEEQHSPAYHGTQASVLPIHGELQQIPDLRPLTNRLSADWLFPYAPEKGTHKIVYTGLNSFFRLDKVTQAAGALLATSDSEPPTPQLLDRANAAAIRFLEQWLSTPDDKGEGWWSSLEEQLESDREFEERDIQ
jgi:hypothetical protein